MEDELKERFMRILDGIIEAAGQLKDVAVEQAPLVVQDYLRWGIVVGIAIALLCPIIAVVGFKINHECKACDADDRIFGKVACWVLCLLSLIPLYIGGLRVMKIIYAPRVYIIDEIRDAMKSPDRR